MAKYCVKCGKVLPEGQEVCPDCSIPAEATDAALFTRITADTEVWKDPREKHKRPRITRSQKEKLGFAVATVLVLAFLAFSIQVTRPASRVIRAVKSGDYDRAVEIFWDSERLAGGEKVPGIDKTIMKEADAICVRFAAQEIPADEAASALSKLGTLGNDAAALLEDTYARFRALCVSQDHMAEGEKLFLNGEYLAARAEYELVAADDGNYAAAQEKAAECLLCYGAEIVAQAGEKSADGNYPDAIAVLKIGNHTLEDYGTFSPDIDAALEQCFADYEAQLLREAENLSALQDNAAAAELLSGGIATYEFDSAAMTAALDNYLKLAREDAIAAAVVRAEEQYEAGEYAAAFAELDALYETLAGDSADIDSEVTALEHRFATEHIEKAEALYGGVRDSLPEAVELLEDAIEIRPLEAMESYLEDIARYLPLNLEDADIVSREGTVFRSSSTFESVHGVNYKDGWLWGADDAEISFRLDGAYDVFEATFAVRRADNRNANASFVIYCDGEKVFKSPTLYHWEKEPIEISVDISGCEELKFVFICDYNVSTTEDGYCYHGLCTPLVMKNLPEAQTAQE